MNTSARTMVLTGAARASTRARATVGAVGERLMHRMLSSTSASTRGEAVRAVSGVNSMTPSNGNSSWKNPPPLRGAPPLPPAQKSATNGRVGNSSSMPPPLSRPGTIGGILPEDIDAVYHQMQHLGNKWADAHAEAEMLEEAKKCVLSTITLHYITDGETKASAEVRAYASQEYQDHIKKMVEARRKANVLKIELESTKTHLNLTRTYEATRREEMKML